MPGSEPYPARVRIFMLLLAVLPCAPGLTFLAAGWVRQPRWHAHDDRAAEQARALRRAGAAVLGAGVLCGALVGWRLVRRHDADTDDAE